MSKENRKRYFVSYLVTKAGIAGYSNSVVELEGPVTLEKIRWLEETIQKGLLWIRRDLPRLDKQKNNVIDNVTLLNIIPLSSLNEE